MLAKIEAAKLCMQSDIKMIIANGLEKNSLKFINSENATWFIPQKNIRSRRHQWIWSRSTKIGVLHIDEGAAKAVYKNSSLLAIGIKKIEGNFFVVILFPSSTIQKKWLVGLLIMILKIWKLLKARNPQTSNLFLVLFGKMK